MDRRTARRAETWRVVVDGAVVGEVGLREPRGDDDDELVVLEVDLADASHTPTLVALLDCRAIEVGARAMTLDLPADAATSARGVLAGSDGFAEVSRRMRLDLDDALPPEPSVRLAPMGIEASAAFLESLAEGYVEERAASGESPDKARQVMHTQLASLLPDGPDTPDQHLSTAWADDVVVGHLWVGTERPGAFVYFVEVVDEQRRRGWGAAVMRAAALWARAEGRGHLGLNVFSHNQAAGALYASLGYTVLETSHRRVVGG